MSNTTEQKIKEILTDYNTTFGKDLHLWSEYGWWIKKLEEVITSERTTLREQIEGLPSASLTLGATKPRIHKMVDKDEVLKLLAHEEEHGTT